MRLPDIAAGGSALTTAGGLLLFHPSPAVTLTLATIHLLGYVTYRITLLRLQEHSQQRAIELIKSVGASKFEGSLIVSVDGQIELYQHEGPDGLSNLRQGTQQG